MKTNNIARIQICPFCGNSYRGVPATSRKDGKTPICPDVNERPQHRLQRRTGFHNVRQHKSTKDYNIHIMGNNSADSRIPICVIVR